MIAFPAGRRVATQPRPLTFDARTASREEMMDRRPWTYQVMADEMIREGKITEERKPGQAINDLRNYVYFDISSNQTRAALSVAVKLKGDPVWRASDWGIANYRIDRSGNFRTTALLPKRARLAMEPPYSLLRELALGAMNCWIR